MQNGNIAKNKCKQHRSKQSDKTVKRDKKKGRSTVQAQKDRKQRK